MLLLNNTLRTVTGQYLLCCLADIICDSRFLVADVYMSHCCTGA